MLLYVELTQDVRKANEELNKRKRKISSSKNVKPVRKVCDENAALVKCQVHVIETVKHNSVIEMVLVW